MGNGLEGAERVRERAFCELPDRPNPAYRLDIEVRPVVFMTVDELEGLVEYVRAGDFTLAEFLREKLGTDRDHKMSVGQFLHRVFLPSQKLSGRRNEYLAGVLDEFKSAWMSRIKSGTDGGGNSQDSAPPGREGVSG